MLSQTEENYIKSIYHLYKQGNKTTVSTNEIAESLQTTAASANDMIKKLSAKNLISHQKYKGVGLLPEGEKYALSIVRKHRLWEVFLVEKLGFNWNEVHVVAEQLEHIKSPKLIDKLDEFLEFPLVDPHGDPIPDKNGVMKESRSIPLNEINIGQHGVLVNVSDDSNQLLSHLNKLNIQLGCQIEVIEKMEFDHSINIIINKSTSQFISKTVAENLMLAVSK